MTNPTLSDAGAWPSEGWFERLSGARPLAAAGRPGGRRFEPTHEARMHAVLELVARRSHPVRTSRLVLISEPALPVGLPDLVAWAIDVERLSARVAAGSPPLTRESHVRAVAAMPIGRAVSAQTVARRIGASEDTVRRALVELASGGYLARKGALWVREAWFAPVGKVHVYEAKTRDWRSGLEQAARYLHHADTATLVVEKLAPSGLLDATALAQRLGVQLYEGDQLLARGNSPRSGQTSKLLASERMLMSVTAS